MGNARIPFSMPVYLLFINPEGDPDTEAFKHDGIMQVTIGGEITCIQLFTEQMQADLLLQFMPPNDHLTFRACAIRDPQRLINYLEDAARKSFLPVTL